MKIYELIYEVDSPQSVCKHTLGFYSDKDKMRQNIDTLRQNLINQIDTTKYHYDVDISENMIILYVSNHGIRKQYYFYTFKWVEKELNTIDTENVKLASHMG